MPVTPPLAVFRADASVEIGFGHMMRCRALADAFGAAGWQCAFASAGENMPGDETSEPGALRGLWPDGCDLLVIDHYRRAAAFEQACRPWARRIMVLDDLANRRHDCDILLDQTLGRQAAEYKALTPEGCCLLMGPEFALLRRQFTPRDVASKCWSGPVRRILVAMGGTDPLDATSAALRWIAAAAPTVHVDVMLGQSAPHRGRVQAIAAASLQPIGLHIGVDDVAGLMAQADMSIGAAGSTSWERCAMGLPALIVILADNQAAIAAALDNAGAAISLGRLPDIDHARAVQALARLCADGEGRAAMSRQAAGICDGRGAARTVAALAA